MVPLGGVPLELPPLLELELLPPLEVLPPLPDPDPEPEPLEDFPEDEPELELEPDPDDDSEPGWPEPELDPVAAPLSPEAPEPPGFVSAPLPSWPWPSWPVVPVPFTAQADAKPSAAKPNPTVHARTAPTRCSILAFPWVLPGRSADGCRRQGRRVAPASASRRGDSATPLGPRVSWPGRIG